MKVTIMVPAWNEEDTLEITVPVLMEYLLKQDTFKDWIVVIINNNSTDGTQEIIDKFSAQYNKILPFFVMHQGRGIALKKAWEGFESDIYGYVDCDLDIDPQAIGKAVSEVKLGNDLVIGSRLHKLSNVNRPLKRSVVTYIFALINKLLFRLPVSDVHCGLKFFNSNIRDSIISSLMEKKWSMDIELILKARKGNFKIKEIPVSDSHNRLVSGRNSKTRFVIGFINFLNAVVKFKKQQLW